MAATVSFHSCVKVKAERGGTPNANWVDFYFSDSDGQRFVVTIFFEDIVLAAALAQAVNQAANVVPAA